MSKKILVIGENCTDIFIYGKSRVPFHRKEQLGVHDDVFEIYETINDPGMAGNVVKNSRFFPLKCSRSTSLSNSIPS